MYQGTIGGQRMLSAGPGAGVGLRRQMGRWYTAALGRVVDYVHGMYAVLSDDTGGTKIQMQPLDGVASEPDARVLVLFVGAGKMDVSFGTLMG